MVKFLSGGQFDGTNVPVCTYWRSDVDTNVEEDFATLVGTEEQINVAKNDPENSVNQCIANAYFNRDDISCFNSGQCNGSGKCLPCTKYKYDGARVAIRHSPPLDILRTFDKGLTDAEVQSPNLAAFPPAAIGQTFQDQLPYHTLLKNIMAEIATCCHWNVGDGSPSRFFVATVLDGPDILRIPVSDENDNVTFIEGIRVQLTKGDATEVEGLEIKNNVFPDEVGSFFPVGVGVVAGFEGQPSFFLEPRTGLIRDGTNIIFDENGFNSPKTQAKTLASLTNQLVEDGVDSAALSCNEATRLLASATTFLANANATNDEATIATAQAQFDQASANKIAACDAFTAASDLGDDAIVLIGEVIDAPNTEITLDRTKQLGLNLESLADEVETAGNFSGGDTQSEVASIQTLRLRQRGSDLKFLGFGAKSKCEFFFNSTDNAAKDWNAPEDGSLPCNGIRTDCPLYTGAPFEFATDEKLEVGKPINAEQIQEIRFRSDDWAGKVNPAEEFQTRFSTPFIWAFKGYIDVEGEPDVRDMLLYRPKILFGRGTPSSSFQTIDMEKVEIINFSDFTLSKTRSRLTPGSERLDVEGPPQFPTIVSAAVVPSNAGLNITHPRQNPPLVYRIWSPDKNKLTLFGTASPNSGIYIVNETALANRQRYHTFFGSKDVFEGVPERLPGSPNFVGTQAVTLQEIFSTLADEKTVNDSQAVLGFDFVEADNSGVWSSVAEVDLVHNSINRVFVFVLQDSINFLVDSVQVDCRFLHSIPVQTNFTATDFTINDTTGSSQLGTNIVDTAQDATITAVPQPLVGNEELLFSHGYMGWRNKDRGLSLGTLNADADLADNTAIADSESSLLPVEADASEFIVNVTYQVVQYRRVDVVVDDWYTIDNCGSIMLVIADNTAHRVLPLPNQQGNVPAFENVLINNGNAGSVVAQFALEEVTLVIKNTDGEEQETKNLVQLFRNTDGFGLPANYIIVGPNPTPTEQTAFGKPDPSKDEIRITYTYLQAQTSNPDGTEADPVNEDDEVVTLNFNGDNIRPHSNLVEFDEDGILTAGGEGNDAVRRDQQEYVWVFADSTGRPVGRKVSRMMVMYYNLSAINVEIYYNWLASCTTYALKPDVSLIVGQNSGELISPLKATLDPQELQLGARVAALLGEKPCEQRPNCGDHEVLRLGPLRREFETIVFGEQFPGGKAIFISAGQSVPTGEGITRTDAPPGSQFLSKRGPLWYPYTSCERPRYGSLTNGPLYTDSTELMNEEVANPGLGLFTVGSDGLGTPTQQQLLLQNGIFGNLVRQDFEAYRGPDRVVARILDIHPSLRPCTSAYTYGNQVLTGQNMVFTGYARRRGEIDVFFYEGLTFTIPPFGNFGRPRLVFEIAEKVGDYLKGNTVGFRWMPLFPEREDLGASTPLFSEDLEPQHYRLTQESNPVGLLSEALPDPLLRYTHKSLIANRVSAGIEYPFVPYFPSFLPDAVKGEEPPIRGADPGVGEVLSTISTSWAWREQEKPIQRGLNGTSILPGIGLESPDYFIDNRRLEVRLRPPEADYVLTFTAPTYNLDGTVKDNALIQLGDGPAREVLIDFANKTLGPASQPDTVYDVSLGLGDDPFPCEPGTASDNQNLSNPCSCISDVTDESIQEENPSQLPARVLHLDELATGNQIALYASTDLQVPFTVDLERDDITQPCCMCLYYIEGVFFTLDARYLPTTPSIDPVFSNQIEDFLYTWSRVPHGTNLAAGGSGVARDGVFSAQENLADNLLNHNNGDVFLTRFTPTDKVLNLSTDGGAVFPSSSLAFNLAADENPILVPGALAAGDPKLKGGTAVNDDNESQGQNETIVMALTFPTYVKIRRVTVTFYAGQGWEVPIYSLGVVDFADRTEDLVTLDTSRIIATSTRAAQDLNIPGIEFLDRAAAEAGFEDGVGARFEETIIPNYDNEPFWNQFGQEFQLIFTGRSSTGSMGVAAIELEVDAFTATDELETVRVPERRYYITEAGAIGNNPEERFSEMDSATAYWRSAETGSTNGANKFRAYSWGEKIEDNQGPEEGSDPREFEELQEREYDTARDLISTPYEYLFNGFIPIDEQNWITFLGHSAPEWTLNLTQVISPLEDVVAFGSQLPLYGVVPDDRRQWHAPGHAWVHNFVEAYNFCCDPCPKEMVVDFNFAHLHDNLQIVETARFWDELPNGLTRLIRSTLLAPDPTFGQSGESGIGISGGTTGRPILIDPSLLVDSQGNPIDAVALENAGFRTDENGDLIIIDNNVGNN